MWTSLLIDLFAVIILLISSLIAAKNGFIKSIVSLAANIVSAVIAFFLCGPISSFFYDIFLSGTVSSGFSSALNQSGINAALANLEPILSKIPFFFADQSAISSQIQQFARNVSGKSAEETTAMFVNTVIKPFAVSGISIVIFLILFFIIRIILKFVTGIITAILEKTPVLGGTNTFLGAVFGLIQGLLILVLISVLLKMAFSYTDHIWILTPNLISGTLAFKYLYNLDILNIIKNLVLKK